MSENYGSYGMKFSINIPLVYLEIIKLLNCIKKYTKEFFPLARDCGEEHIEELGTKLGQNNEEVDAEEICRSVPYWSFGLFEATNSTSFHIGNEVEKVPYPLLA